MTTVSAMCPLYKRLKMSLVVLTGVAAMANGVMNRLPWGGPTSRAATALKADASDVFVPMVPALAVGLLSAMDVLTACLPVAGALLGRPALLTVTCFLAAVLCAGIALPLPVWTWSPPRPPPVRSPGSPVRRRRSRCWGRCARRGGPRGPDG
ncbi:hypothetical protein BIV25_31330 [Streptomyces sp. MUSC 14]|nr:hypothetical protein BIV25_31330 [Streptomyces sp. MUSC 14]